MDRFRLQLRRQLSFLDRSCASFDVGYRDEAVRIAVSIRVIVHDTKASTSLLSHLGATTIKLLSTVRPLPSIKGVLGYDGLTVLSGQGTIPWLDRAPYQVEVPLQKWWAQVVYVVGPGPMTRKDLVLAAANKDGGAHVDAALTAEYESLFTMYQRVAADGGETPVTDVQLVGLRQLGFELLHSPELRALLHESAS